MREGRWSQEPTFRIYVDIISSLALSVGGFFFGFVGLRISVPAAVGVKLVTVRGLERYRSSELYESPQG